jgi:hypothetical protein
MKNIHLIATDKPTGIFQSNSGLQFSIRDKVRVEPLKGFHIYITNDEVIKEGAWRCDIELNRIEKGKETGTFKNWKKIILTTDQDLIKDGVRAIGDDFLEWFVKNPSCEFVEIDSTCKCVTCNSSVKSSCDYAYKCRPQIFYKIIIPQEEQTKCYCGHTSFCDCGPKEETFIKTDNIDGQWLSPVPTERAWQEEKLVEIFGHYPTASPRWQYMNGLIQNSLDAKQMYNEEDMIEFAVWMYLEVGSNKGKERTNKELFEQFKKEIKE